MARTTRGPAWGGRFKPFLRTFGRWARDVLFIVGGASLMALSVDMFLDPNNVVPGGFTALSIFANRLWGWPVGVVVLIMNIPFLLIGMAVLGVQFGPKTLLGTVVSSLAIDALRPYVPVVQGEPLLYIFYGGLLYGAGQGLIFRVGGSSGGTETPAKLLQHYFGIRLARSLLVMDMVILAGAAWLFGLAPALYAFIAAWVMSRVVDVMELGVNADLTVFILCKNPDPVRQGVLTRLERGVTILAGEGGYTGEPRTVLFVVVTRHQMGALRELVRAADPDAFMVINPSHEVLGEGFKPLTRVRR